MLHLIYKNGFGLCVCVCKLDSHEENFTACCCFFRVAESGESKFFLAIVIDVVYFDVPFWWL
jgi:hypothetical protein